MSVPSFSEPVCQPCLHIQQQQQQQHINEKSHTKIGNVEDIGCCTASSAVLLLHVGRRGWLINNGRIDFAQLGILHFSSHGVCVARETSLEEVL